MPDKNDDDLLTIAEAAAELKVTPRAVNQLIARGVLPVRAFSPRIRRIRRADLLAAAQAA